MKRAILLTTLMLAGVFASTISIAQTMTLDRIRETGEFRTGLMTGTRFRSMDRITNGFLPGHLIILAARPGIEPDLFTSKAKVCTIQPG